DRARARWDKVYLPAEQKIDLIKQMDMFMNGSAGRPQALLLKGPPGTGKTLLAQTMAEVAGSKFYKLSISDIKHPNLGESAQRVARIWKEARANEPAILFLDECESLFGKRGAAETDVIGTDIVQSFLSQWDGKESGLWVMGATNRRDLIDEAVLSRFGAEVEIGLPDEESRRLILEQELRQHGAAISVSQEAARQTQGFSGRDLAMLAGRIMADAHPANPTQEIMLRAIRKQRVNGNAGIDTQATWNSLVLAPETMASLQTVCSMLKDAEGWKANGATLPTGILLSGLPGTGKTQIARTMANESGLSFVAATTADLKANFLGQSANRVKNLFERVRASAPAILFLDEIDILAGDRAVSGNDAIVQEVIGQLLQEIDGIRKSTCEVFVLAATNRPESLDRAILSRFTEQISIPLPDLDGRRLILEILLQPKKVDFDRALACQSLAEMSDGKSGRDLKNWIARAEQKAVQRAVVKGGPEHFMLALDDFNAA
ncbi:MAG: AAA family ATPase, partial [Candidatus Saccharimonadales bacterium]